MDNLQLDPNDFTSPLLEVIERLVGQNAKLKAELRAAQQLASTQAANNPAVE